MQNSCEDCKHLGSQHGMRNLLYHVVGIGKQCSYGVQKFNGRFRIARQGSIDVKVGNGGKGPRLPVACPGFGTLRGRHNLASVCLLISTGDAKAPNKSGFRNLNMIGEVLRSLF